MSVREHSDAGIKELCNRRNMQPSNQPSSSCTPLAWICSHTVERRERVCAYHCSSIQTENTHTVHNRGRQSSQEDSGMNKNRKEKQKRVHLLPRPKSVMSQLMFPRLSKAKHPLRSGCDSKCNTLDRFRGMNSLFFPFFFLFQYVESAPSQEWKKKSEYLKQ